MQAVLCALLRSLEGYNLHLLHFVEHKLCERWSMLHEVNYELEVAVCMKIVEA
jgi:hypothetical protein